MSNLVRQESTRLSFMKKKLKAVLRMIVIFQLILLGFVGGYFLYAKTIGIIKVEGKLGATPSVPIYILSNGVHTDVVMPINNSVYNWAGFLDFSDTRQPNSNWNYVAMGWGDKGFYLNTPTWDDLTFSTAISAAFGLGGTAMHVTYYKNIKVSKRCKKILITETQYKNLVNQITQSFQVADSKPLYINTDAVYGTNDAFYEANGKYSVFKTCNVWTNNTLKSAGITAKHWTPFSEQVMAD